MAQCVVCGVPTQKWISGLDGRPISICGGHHCRRLVYQNLAAFLASEWERHPDLGEAGRSDSYPFIEQGTEG